MGCDVRKMTHDDADNCFHFLAGRIGKPTDCKFDAEDIRWAIVWRGPRWVLEMSTFGVNADGMYVRPTLNVNFYPDRVKTPLLRYDVALIMEPSGRPHEHAVCHRELALLLLNNFRAHGPIGSRLADHLSLVPVTNVEARLLVRDKLLTPDELSPITGDTTLGGVVTISPTRLARWLCRVGLHPLVKTNGGGMGDAKRCLVCGHDKYPEVFDKWALVTLGIISSQAPSGTVTGRFTDTLNEANAPKEAQS